LGWALLHFVWQGALVALALAAVLPLLRSAGARYRAACLALALMAALPLFTFSGIHTSPASEQITATQEPVFPAAERGPAPVLDEPSFGSEQALRALPHRMLPWLVALWSLGASLLLLRLLAAWAYTGRLKSHRVAPVPGELQHRFEALLRHLRITRPVRLLQSSRVAGPIVVGYLRPVVLLPVSVLAGLAPWQVELILRHELAHVRRHDALVNALQVVVEAVLFYHPAVWWVSGRIRVYREECCDDAVVGLEGGAAQRYARALLALEGLRGGGGVLTLGVTGGSLVERIERLLTPEQPGARWASPAVAAALIMGLFGLALFGTHLINPKSGTAPLVVQEVHLDSMGVKVRLPEDWISKSPTFLRFPNSVQSIGNYVAHSPDTSHTFFITMFGKSGSGSFRSAFANGRELTRIAHADQIIRLTTEEYPSGARGTGFVALKTYAQEAGVRYKTYAFFITAGDDVYEVLLGAKEPAFDRLRPTYDAIISSLRFDARTASERSYRTDASFLTPGERP
jgi:beta-lactamase regulating signal transducer with metallopeptidase domain